MGDWMRVHIVGSCPAEQLEPLRKAINPDTLGPDGHGLYHPLLGGDGLCGVGPWANEHINAVGNCYERGFTHEDVAKACQEHLVPAAPGLSIDVHCGGPYESDACVATVQVRRGQVVVLQPPLVEKIPPISEGQIASRLFAHLSGWNRRGQ